MKTTTWVFLFLSSTLFFASCSAGQANGSTMTSLPTTTLVPTQTLTPTSVPLAYSPVPRHMLLDQAGYGIEILGEAWNYTSDRWNESYACIDYARARQPHVFLEQCFAFSQPSLTLESERDKYLSDSYEVLQPTNTFGHVGQLSVLAIRVADNSGNRVKIFELLGSGNYLLRVEMNITTDDMSELQRIYEEQAAAIFDYVLQNMLEKSRPVPHPIPTP